MNALRRIHVVAGVIAASAAAGAGAGLLVAGAILATKLGHARPMFFWELVKLGSQTGAAFGLLIGPPTVLGVLRRVPLNHLARSIMIGATSGGIAGFAVSLAFAEPRPAIPLILTGSLVGFSLAAVRLWARFRESHRSVSVPSVG